LHEGTNATARLIHLIRVVFTFFNVLVLCVLVWVFAYRHLENLYFDVNFSLEEKLNKTMVGRSLPSDSRRIELIFQPQRTARGLYLVFNYRDMEGDYQALRLGSQAGLPTAWLEFRDGWPVEATLPGDVAGAERQSVVIDLENNRLEIAINGRRLFAREFLLRGDRLCLVFYPPFVGVRFRPPAASILSMNITDGAGRVQRMLPQWTRLSLAGAAVTAVVLLFLTVDRRLRRAIWRRKRRHRRLNFLDTYPAWPAVFVLVMIGLLIKLDQNQRFAEQATWFGAYLENGRFHRAAFLQQPVLTREDETRRIDLSPDVQRVLAFGGSTTHGVPYPQGCWDWPTQLEALLNERAAEDRDWQVINLGFRGNYLSTNFPPGVEGFLEAVQPRLVIVHNLINEYYKERPRDNIMQSLGFGEWISADGPGELAAFTAQLREVLAMLRENGIATVVVDPPLDGYFYGADPLAAWRDAQRQVAAENGACYVPLQEKFDNLEQRFVFYENMHLTRLGYRLLAVEIFRALEAELVETDQAEVTSTAPSVARPAP